MTGGEHGRTLWKVWAEDTYDTIVIGDSNLKQVCNAPTSWKVFCFPGLTFHDLPLIMEKSVRRKLKNLVLVLGINHRDDVVDNTYESIDKSWVSIGKTYPTTTIYATGISTKRNNKLSVTLGTLQMETVTYINDYLNNKAGNNYYIKPLPALQVSLAKDNLHHEQVTVDNVIKSIADRLN